MSLYVINDVFICDKDKLAVLDKFLASFYVSNKITFQNYFANKLIKCFVFEAVQNTRSTCLLKTTLQRITSTSEF